VLTTKLNCGTPWPNANSPPKTKTTLIGFLAYATHHYTRAPPNLNHSNPTSPLWDGTADSKSGTLTLKLNTPSRLTRDKLIQFQSHPMLNIWPLVERTKNYISGILWILTISQDNLMLEAKLIKLPSIQNSNGLQ
jgi:hypothetical protein